ncbi:hypothetical protein [Bradyrhizobium sp. HKCCYLS2033]|uniref:hypothetical protein n=1 Tax=Bradyrhizobium sp. HKCCYLS2033 TaxID=3420739 RepID=UPI003EBABB65
MNAHTPDAAITLPFGDLDDFREYCEIEADMVARGWVSFQHGVDTSQWAAERWHLVDVAGQDAVQAVMAAVFGRLHAAPDQVELDDEAPPLAPEPEPPSRRRRPAQSTIDAFWYVVRTETPDGIAAWLARHPADAAHLHTLLKARLHA